MRLSYWCACFFPGEALLVCCSGTWYMVLLGIYGRLASAWILWCLCFCFSAVSARTKSCFEHYNICTYSGDPLSLVSYPSILQHKRSRFGETQRWSLYRWGVKSSAKLWALLRAERKYNWEMIALAIHRHH